jgi:hypothetical protein
MRQGTEGGDQWNSEEVNRELYIYSSTYTNQYINEVLPGVLQGVQPGVQPGVLHQVLPDFTAVHAEYPQVLPEIAAV